MFTCSEKYGLTNPCFKLLFFGHINILGLDKVRNYFKMIPVTLLRLWTSETNTRVKISRELKRALDITDYMQTWILIFQAHLATTEPQKSPSPLPKI